MQMEIGAVSHAIVKISLKKHHHDGVCLSALPRWSEQSSCNPIRLTLILTLTFSLLSSSAKWCREILHSKRLLPPPSPLSDVSHSPSCSSPFFGEMGPWGALASSFPLLPPSPSFWCIRFTLHRTSKAFLPLPLFLLRPKQSLPSSSSSSDHFQSLCSNIRLYKIHAAAPPPALPIRFERKRRQFDFCPIDKRRTNRADYSHSVHMYRETDREEMGLSCAEQKWKNGFISLFCPSSLRSSALLNNGFREIPPSYCHSFPKLIIPNTAVSLYRALHCECTVASVLQLSYSQYFSLVLVVKSLLLYTVQTYAAQVMFYLHKACVEWIFCYK